MRILEPSFVELKLPVWMRLGLLVTIVALGLFLSIGAVRVGLAARLEASVRLPDLRRAAALDPGDPESHHRLGMALFAQLAIASPESAGDVDPDATIRELRRATELSAHQAPYWSDLALACDALGDLSCADQAFEQALKLGPTTPRYYWLAANHSLRKGDNAEAMARFGQLLTMDPSYAASTFEICLRVIDDPEALYLKVLPGQSDLPLRMAYVDALMDHGKADFAYQIWREAVAHTTHFSFSLAQPFVDRLIDLNHGPEAQAVWLDLLRRGIVTQPSSDPPSLVFNGDFEQIPLDAGFDWRYPDTPYVALDFGDPSAYHNGHCLRVDFTVARDQEFEPVFQWVALQPNQTYLLSAYARSDELSSESGPRLRVVDPFCQGCLDVSTESTVGTTDWHRISVDFTTTPTTHLVRISLWRPRSLTFPREIEGTFRLDYVLLRPITSKAGVSPDGAS